VRKQGDIIVVRFGEHRLLDERAVERLGDELYSVADRADCQKLLLNFASVEGITSMMLGKLVMIQKKMNAKGGKLKLCDLAPEVQEVFAATKLNQIFDILESEGEGVAAFA
jgi:anti-sigma B factor antagonist